MAFDPFDRDAHGSLHDRGNADAFYRRPRTPHYGGVGGDSGERTLIFDEDAAAQAEYHAGYDEGIANGEFKDYGDDR